MLLNYVENIGSGHTITVKGDLRELRDREGRLLAKQYGTLVVLDPAWQQDKWTVAHTIRFLYLPPSALSVRAVLAGVAAKKILVGDLRSG